MDSTVSIESKDIPSLAIERGGAAHAAALPISDAQADSQHKVEAFVADCASLTDWVSSSGNLQSQLDFSESGKRFLRELTTSERRSTHAALADHLRSIKEIVGDAAVKAEVAHLNGNLDRNHSPYRFCVVKAAGGQEFLVLRAKSGVLIATVSFTPAFTAIRKSPRSDVGGTEKLTGQIQTGSEGGKDASPLPVGADHGSSLKPKSDAIRSDCVGDGEIESDGFLAPESAITANEPGSAAHEADAIRSQCDAKGEIRDLSPPLVGRSITPNETVREQPQVQLQETLVSQFLATGNTFLKLFSSIADRRAAHGDLVEQLKLLKQSEGAVAAKDAIDRLNAILDTAKAPYRFCVSRMSNGQDCLCLRDSADRLIATSGFTKPTREFQRSKIASALENSRSESSMSTRGITTTMLVEPGCAENRLGQESIVIAPFDSSVASSALAARFAPGIQPAVLPAEPTYWKPVVTEGECNAIEVTGALKCFSDGAEGLDETPTPPDGDTPLTGNFLAGMLPDSAGVPDHGDADNDTHKWPCGFDATANPGDGMYLLGVPDPVTSFVDQYPACFSNSPGEELQEPAINQTLSLAESLAQNVDGLNWTLPNGRLVAEDSFSIGGRRFARELVQAERYAAHAVMAEHLGSIKETIGDGSVKYAVEQLNNNLQKNHSPYRFNITRMSNGQEFLTLRDTRGKLIGTIPFTNQR